VYISDEYGPYVYEFDRASGRRVRMFKLPDSLFVRNLSPLGNAEISENASGRTANKGMEGLAIAPDGRTLVGVIQAALIQDANSGGNLLRIVTIDVASGRTIHQYGYLLTDGSGVSEIIALNDHEFVVDERDGKGRADGSKAKIKELFRIDLNGATDISDMDGATATAHAVPKKLFANLVSLLQANGFDPAEIPAKIEGVSFGPDVQENGTTIHTLWIANDNDFLSAVADPNGNTIPNPNQIFVFGFTDADLDGSRFVPQQFRSEGEGTRNIPELTGIPNLHSALTVAR
jgi:hypothetical protein